MKRGESKVWVQTFMNRLISRESSILKGSPKSPRSPHLLPSETDGALSGRFRRSESFNAARSICAVGDPFDPSGAA